MIEKQNNPLDYVTENDLINLGLSWNEIANSYQPSDGGFWHARGGEGTGKTLLIAHMVREKIDIGRFTTGEFYTNTEFKGKYRTNNILKGDDMKQLLWDMLIKEKYTGIMIFISELESLFPARKSWDSDQYEIALRMWHIHKLHNFVYADTHLGNSADLIFHLSTHYFLYPHYIDWDTQSLNYSIVNRLNHTIEDDWIAQDIIKTMLIYSRRDRTEKLEDDMDREMGAKKRNKSKKQINIENNFDFEIDIEKERLGFEL